MSSIVGLIIISTGFLIILNERRNAQERMTEFKKRVEKMKELQKKKTFYL
jgi:uncharacterized membrane protein (DUF106 family)